MKGRTRTATRRRSFDSDMFPASTASAYNTISKNKLWELLHCNNICNVPRIQTSGFVEERRFISFQQNSHLSKCVLFSFRSYGDRPTEASH